MEGRTNPIEGVLRKIEERVERWRKEKQARLAEVEADRDELWAEAVERERLLADATEVGEPQRRPAGEICREQKAVFIIHSREVKKALQGLSRDEVSLVRVIPVEDASRPGVGLEGSWLVFE